MKQDKRRDYDREMAWKRREEEWASASRKVILTLQQQYPLLFAIVALPIMHLIPTPPPPQHFAKLLFPVSRGHGSGECKSSNPPPPDVVTVQYSAGKEFTTGSNLPGKRRHRVIFMVQFSNTVIYSL